MTGSDILALHNLKLVETSNLTSFIFLSVLYRVKKRSSYVEATHVHSSSV